MQAKFMTSRRFAPLFWTQFLSAFNDNFLKNTLVFLILFQLPANDAGSLITLAGAIFMAPFLVFSALGGQLADKYDKSWLAQKLKLAEIGAAGIAVVGLGLSSIPVLMSALFLFGLISALFGPIKYGILPDHLEKSELPKANAWIEAATFIAILGGTIVGGLASIGGVNITLFGPIMMAFGAVCWLASRFIPKTGSAAPEVLIEKNVLRSTWSLLRDLRKDTKIWRASLMAAWFWLVGAVLLSLLPTLVKNLLGGNELAVTAYLAVFAVAVAVGSAIAAWLSAGRVVLLPAPIGTALMALFGFDLAWSLSNLTDVSTTATLAEFFTRPNAIRVAIDLAGLAIAGAFLIVPSFTAVQTWADESRRARIIAAVNILSAGFMTIGGAVVAGIQTLDVGIPAIMLGLALLNAVVAYLMLRHLPTNAFRDFVSIFFRAFHRLEVQGLENLKKAGVAPIIALNHVSFLDGALALALTDEEPVFAVDYNIAQKWWAKPFLKLCNFLPLDPSKPMATRTLIRAVNERNPLVIFPEGRITVTGGLMKVYDGAAMVADKTGSMVVPVKIEGLEKSYFSRLTSSHVRRSLFPKVTVKIMEPVKLCVPEELQGSKRRSVAGSNLYQTMTKLVFDTTDTNLTVLERLIETAKNRGLGEMAIQDPLTGSMSYRKLLSGVAVLGNKFQNMFADQQNVGVMLPNANATVMLFLGLVSAGKIPAMINYTAGSSNILAGCKGAQIRTILTSREFVDQGKLESVVSELQKVVNIVWVDDLRHAISRKEKLLGMLHKTKPRAVCKADDPAVILFTSGSEGTPKGVVLTHRNLLSNAAQAASRIDFHSGDKVFNMLPVFHSFGLTAGTILPLISGVPVFFYPSPLHYRIIPELVYGSNATIIFGTDTFLSGYARTAHPYDFRSIRYCFSGAEPVKPTTRQTYMEKFGIRILEGYGVTETSPVISINTPMYNKSGTVGRIMPGLQHRLEPVPGIEEGGRLFVKGPNVMAGYLLADQPGVLRPLDDGWHDTGDIVTIDDDDFVTIRGRAKRFAKIGGEMVSLAAIEQLAAEFWPGSLSVAVSVPDPRKGERIILVTDAEDATREQLHCYAKSRGATDLMVPAAVQLGNVPVLGSGKVDFVSAKAMVEKAIKQKHSSAEVA